MGYEVIALKDQGPTVTPRLKRDANADIVIARLAKALQHEGLFPDEARTAVTGVKQAWFAPGVRVIYFLPRQIADDILTMHISPTPSEHARVYAVCVELITPEMRQACLEKLIALNLKNTDECNDFLNSSPLIKPMLAQLLAQLPDDHDQKTTRQKITQLMNNTLAER